MKEEENILCRMWNEIDLIEKVILWLLINVNFDAPGVFQNNFCHLLYTFPPPHTIDS